MGAAGGYFGGGEAAAGTAGTEGGAVGGTESGLTSGTANLDTGGAMGLGTGGEGAQAVQTSVGGSPAAVPASTPVTTPLADTVSALDTGGAMAGGGSTAAPTQFDQAMTAAQQGKSFDPNNFFGTNGPATESLTQPSANYSNMTDQYGNKYTDLYGNKFTEAMDAANKGKSYGWENVSEVREPSMMDKFGNWLSGGKGTGKMGLEDYLKMQGKAQLLGGGVKALGALATAPETQQNKNALMDLYNQQQQQAQYYDNLMRGTYTNPQGYLGSPEAAATRSAALQKILAQNAQAGRRTAGGAAYNQLMMNQLQNLNQYRQGMPRPTYGAALQTLQGAQQYSPTADIFGGLASMATPLSLYSLYNS